MYIYAQIIAYFFICKILDLMKPQFLYIFFPVLCLFSFDWCAMRFSESCQPLI